LWVVKPLVAVTVTPSVADWLLTQDNVVEPWVTSEVGFREQNIPVGYDAVSVTVPANPFMGLTLIVDVPLLPTMTPTSIGFAVIEKSGVDITLNIIETEWVRLPEVPVTVTLLTLGTASRQSSDAVPAPTTNPGKMLHSMLVDELGKTVSETFPANPPRADTVMNENPVWA